LALIGIGTALLAAVPGFIDYFTVVPPRSTGKARATKHMIANLIAVGLFIVAVMLRRDSQPTDPATLPLILEGLAVGLLSVAGWMGGTLVTRNQIGVDHRYANAGQWQEERVSTARGEPAVIAGELEVNQMKLVIVNGRRIVLARTADGYFAVDDACSHRGASLADGALICGTVQCPWHGSQFAVKDGEVKAGPAKKGIATHKIEVKGGKILLK
jgi:nitrite reductase/ring-hydroxylating ferredoxin subunit